MCRLLRVVVPAAAALAVLGLGGCQHQQHDYDAATREAFMQVCRQGKNTPGEQTCGCYYDQLMASMDFDDFAKLDRSMKDDPAFTPDVVVQAVAKCAGGGPPAQSSAPASSGSADPSATDEVTDGSDAGPPPDSTDATDSSDSGAGGIFN
jgi:hypothetical protein